MISCISWDYLGGFGRVVLGGWFWAGGFGYELYDYFVQFTIFGTVRGELFDDFELFPEFGPARRELFDDFELFPEFGPARRELFDDFELFQSLERCVASCSMILNNSPCGSAV
ncbi:hypothetical protein [Cohnella terricola]|uniref:Uncharacterized protein n=1 Tax=Cohnella terricola TaxID=1289167 RepID=A0A559JEG6_9BACL|nr:hypothetical protein [Cohnella terricola]TVX98263.1 hypothetical protein FPZ45_16315 [Cohnella terricola]